MTVQTSSISEKAAHVHAGRLVLILGSLTALGPLSVDMYLPAFPNMASTLGTNLSSVETSLASYFAGLSFGQLFYGPLADRYGRKGPLLIGLAIYALASVACAMAQSIEAVIALRFMQALGACGGMVIPRAIVRDRFEHQESARIFSLLMLIMGVAPILAPLLGGYFSLNFGWRSIFWFLVAFSSLAIVGAGMFLPETHGAHPEHKMKGSFSTFGRILRDREFLRYTLSGSIAQAGMFAYITGSPFVFIEYFGIPADKFGWVFGSNALGLIAVSQLNARLLRTFSYEKILTVAIRIVAVAGTLLMIAGVANAGLWAVMIPLFLYVATLGATFPNAAAGALASQGRNAGSASAMLGTLQMMAASLASFILSKMHATSAAPMTVIVGVCGLLSLLIFTLMKKPQESKEDIAAG
ncbi:MAG TPA: Bcr/CflA family multidrug efflux MFS transporter [Oligoflexus sp.]|uniref:Bcr/CflA family multidrug efflux MFS transporter n=1 Tax=Oligoflexus sp. TaxID=1971216 RepID=UPI002D7F130E|nr:Bcr/CflA family multidrug efflux MFS transporter [Oligoflexus sp.]HET9237372.1 Bcr/CflA family multidrug efflux MFS transporter [Oligoflexus sp.]